MPNTVVNASESHPAGSSTVDRSSIRKVVTRHTPGVSTHLEDGHHPHGGYCHIAKKVMDSLVAVIFHLLFENYVSTLSSSL
jgi:hypothetical protein